MVMALITSGRQVWPYEGSRFVLSEPTLTYTGQVRATKERRRASCHQMGQMGQIATKEICVQVASGSGLPHLFGSA